MKKLVSILLLLVTSLVSNAQYVTIPDSNFVSYLQDAFPSAMSGNQMDTTAPVITNASSVSCHSKNIESLQGIQYFDALLYLTCSYNKITNLPNLPNNLNVMYCGNNKLVSLPSLPKTLQTLYCNDNQLVSLPSLPNSLGVLSCGSNKLINLPSLPQNLRGLFCEINQLSSLPILPISLRSLYCSSNRLSDLPILPQYLKELRCTHNQLTSIPSLYNSLEELLCRGNQLLAIPVLPNSLVVLDCGSNKLKELPSLPPNLKNFSCYDNQLTSIPTLPRALESFSCINNPQLNCLPYFSQNTFKFFRVRSQTNIRCLPKAITVTNDDDKAEDLPICSPVSGCPISYSIVGNIHQDTSLDCTADSLNNGPLLKGFKVLAYINNQLQWQTYTDINGFYSFDAEIGDSVNIKLDNAYSSSISCPLDGERKAEVTVIDSLIENLDFGLKCNGLDMSVYSIHGSFRPTRNRPVLIQVSDVTHKLDLICASGKSGIVKTTIIGSASYVAPLNGSLTPTTIAEDILTYTITDFGAINPDSAFNIIVTTDSNATIGSDICIETIVSTMAIDHNSANDTLLFCGEVVNSYDPNDKAAFPRDITTPDSWITYTIRYQNTGTDTAYNIFIRDTLSAYLDESTFTYLDGSVRPQIHLTGKAILFNLPNINLLDSFSSQPESHGWLQYKVKTKADLSYDDVITNTAYIYFDQNDPVVTNTTSNVYVEPTVGIKRNRLTESFKVYPNPTAGNITIAFEENHSHIQTRILSITGQEIAIHTTSNSNTLQFDFEAAKGIYFVEITTENGGKSVVRVVKE